MPNSRFETGSNISASDRHGDRKTDAALDSALWAALCVTTYSSNRSGVFEQLNLGVCPGCGWGFQPILFGTIVAVLQSQRDGPKVPRKNKLIKSLRVQISKSEYRNPKQINKSEYRNPKVSNGALRLLVDCTRTTRPPFLSFAISVIRICFGFRDSIFVFWIW